MAENNEPNANNRHDRVSDSNHFSEDSEGVISESSKFNYKDYETYVQNQSRVLEGYNDKPEDKEDADDIHRILMANGIYRKEDYDDFNSFYIFHRNDPYKMFGVSKEYVFITKPDLHIFNDPKDTSVLNPELEGSLFFKDLMTRGYKDSVLKSLQLSANTGDSRVFNSPFINLLTNYATSNLDLSNISVGDLETAVNIYNTRIFYRKPSDSADEDNEFSMEYKDNKYLDCYLFFKAYDLYEQLKYHGKITPVTDEYTYYKVLSDQMTAFKFVVGEDGETIQYWACLWGCYPKSVPRTTFSDTSQDGMIKFTIDWKATFQQDMDPAIIKHFNTIVEHSAGIDSSNNPEKSLLSKFQNLPLYDYGIGRVTGESAEFPYITRDSSRTHSPYVLTWFRDKK